LIYSDDFKVPAYTRQEIHLQPGGFTDDPLGGVVFHYGTMVFYEGINDQDELYKELAELTVLPEGKCDRILDVACAIGQGTMALKELYPDVEVTGLDVGLPLIKYGHYRAVERGLDVTFTQGLAEDMPYDDGHFDAILSYLLYHERRSIGSCVRAGFLQSLIFRIIMAKHWRLLTGFLLILTPGITVSHIQSDLFIVIFLEYYGELVLKFLRDPRRRILFFSQSLPKNHSNCQGLSLTQEVYRTPMKGYQFFGKLYPPCE